MEESVVWWRQLHLCMVKLLANPQTRPNPPANDNFVGFLGEFCILNLNPLGLSGVGIEKKSLGTSVGIHQPAFFILVIIFYFN